MKRAAIVLMLAGCVAPPPPRVAPRAAVAAVAHGVAEPAARPEPPVAAKLPACVIPPVAVREEGPSEDAQTCVDHRAIEKQVAPVLARRYSPVVPGAAVEARFGCDPLLYEPLDVVFGTGSGHGGSLSIWHLFRDEDATTFEVVGYLHSMPWETYDQYTYAVADRFETAIVRATLPASKVLAALAIARPAMTATFRELVQPLPRTALHGFSLSGSSYDFHALLRVEDGVNAIEREFTGYEGNDQEAYLGVQLAVETLAPLVDNLAPSADGPTAAERAWLTDRILAMHDHLEDEYAWWVRERVVHLAGRFGTPELLGLVVADLRRALRELDKQPEERRAELAMRLFADDIIAFVRLGGFDPRTPGDRPADEAAREIVAACAG
jgi:hypothetical protein